ncbi:hypothetical protein TNCV_5031371 [Trichonephila clavipes]|nr:hypothetical protein TNCV_5031371 [Trichonephila clavipes]
MKKYVAEDHRMLSNTYGGAAISERTCREWFQRFKNGAFDIKVQHGIWDVTFAHCWYKQMQQNTFQHHTIKTRKALINWTERESNVVRHAYSDTTVTVTIRISDAHSIRNLTICQWLQDVLVTGLYGVFQLIILGNLRGHQLSYFEANPLKKKP